MREFPGILAAAIVVCFLMMIPAARAQAPGDVHEVYPNCASIRDCHTCQQVRLVTSSRSETSADIKDFEYLLVRNGGFELQPGFAYDNSTVNGTASRCVWCMDTASNEPYGSCTEVPDAYEITLGEVALNPAIDPQAVCGGFELPQAVSLLGPLAMDSTEQHCPCAAHDPDGLHFSSVGESKFGVGHERPHLAQGTVSRSESDINTISRLAPDGSSPGGYPVQSFTSRAGARMMCRACMQKRHPATSGDGLEAQQCGWSSVYPGKDPRITDPAIYQNMPQDYRACHTATPTGWPFSYDWQPNHASSIDALFLDPAFTPAPAADGGSTVVARLRNADSGRDSGESVYPPHDDADGVTFLDEASERHREEFLFFNTPELCTGYDASDPYFGVDSAEVFLAAVDRWCPPGFVPDSRRFSVSDPIREMWDGCVRCPENTYSFWGFTQCLPCQFENNGDIGTFVGVQCPNSTLAAAPGYWCEAQAVPGLNPTPAAFGGQETSNFDGVVDTAGGGDAILFRDTIWDRDVYPFDPVMSKWSLGLAQQRSLTTSTVLMSECFIDPSLCLGGQCCPSDGYTYCESCVPGHAGALCTSCQDRFYKLNNQCLPCPSTDLFLLYIILGVLLFMILVFILFRGGGGRLGRVSVGTFKISADFFQVTALFASFRVAWPPYLNFIWGFFNIFNLDLGLLAPECASDEFKDEVFKIQLMMFIPLTFIALFLLIALGRYVINLGKLRISSTTWFVNKGIRGFVYFFSFGYLFLASKALAIFDCKQLDDSRWIWEPVPTSECWFVVQDGEDTSAWIRAFPASIVGTIVYAMFIPVLLRYLLRINKEHLFNEVVEDRYGPIFVLYSPAHYKWEFWIMIRKIALAAISLWLTTRPVAQAALSLGVLSVYMYWDWKYHPYRYYLHNMLENLLIGCQAVVLVVALILSLGVRADSSGSLYSFVTGFAASSVLVALAAIAYVVWKEIRFRVLKDKNEIETRLVLEKKYEIAHAADIGTLTDKQAVAIEVTEAPADSAAPAATAVAAAAGATAAGRKLSTASSSRRKSSSSRRKSSSSRRKSSASQRGSASPAKQRKSSGEAETPAADAVPASPAADEEAPMLPADE